MDRAPAQLTGFHIEQAIKDENRKYLAELSLARHKKNWATLNALVDEYGFCDVITALGNRARDREDEEIGGQDFSFVAQVCEAASAAVDLPYSVRNIRPETLENFRDAVARIKP